MFRGTQSSTSSVLATGYPTMWMRVRPRWKPEVVPPWKYFGRPADRREADGVNEIVEVLRHGGSWIIEQLGHSLDGTRCSFPASI